MCPGRGSSNSSTSPSACGSALTSFRAKGGGLRDLVRASLCRKGIGENIGVVGTDVDVPWNKSPVVVVDVLSPSGEIGKESHVEVTSRVFSTARRYFPTDL